MYKNNLYMMDKNGSKYNIDIFDSLSNTSVLNSIRTNGRSKSPDDVNLLEIFYEVYKTRPLVFKVSSSNSYYDMDKLKDKLSKIYPDKDVIYSDVYYTIDDNCTYTCCEIWDLKNGTILQLNGDKTSEFYLVNCDLDKITNICNDNIFLSKGKFDDIKKVSKVFKQCQIKTLENVTIGMISFSDGCFHVKDFDINKQTVDLKHMDLHYGEGFTEFNNELLLKLNTITKGLTLFHGAPGTGKTFYIRYLLKKLKQHNKKNNILYFPPTMIDTITEPNFIDFISDWVSETEGKNYLLLEDAEPLLESRNNIRNIGITNLLNLTDGILNDILSIQIIATFNTNLQNIDEALLRAERLTARKEFKKLPLENAKELADKIGIDHDLIKDDMSLADIYSLKKDNKILTHDVFNSKTKRIGF